MRHIISLVFLMLVYTCSMGQSAEFIAARARANTDISRLGCKYDPKRNVYYTNDDVLHIFIFEDGNLLVAGYPTTALEKSKFQVHLYIKSINTESYSLEYSGSYTPVLNIVNTNPSPAPAPGPLVVPPPPPAISTIDFVVIGPFTNSVTITLKHKQAAATDYTTLASSTIQISKTIHVSIGSGIFYTTLKDPSNIRTSTLPNGDTTLIADDPAGRGLLAVTATFYPWPRNSLLIPSWRPQDRLGVLVGTTIGTGSSNFKNVLMGLQYDFAIGGSIITGVHLGRRQRIQNVNYNDFTFGKSKYSGDLQDQLYMSWDAGFFIGVQIDSRVFTQIFK